MKNKKVILTTLSLLLCLTIVSQSFSNAKASPQLDTIVLYMAADNTEPLINTEVNITLVFKNLLDVEFDMYNITMDVECDPGLNITNVNDVPFDNEINTTDLFVYGTNSTPVMEWNNTNIKAAWAVFEVGMIQFFWFIVNCTEDSNQNINAPVITYELDGEEETFTGKATTITVRTELNTSSVPNPIRGEWVLYWWFSGAIIITVPLVVIVITRLTLWKR